MAMGAKVKGIPALAPFSPPAPRATFATKGSH
jgi:hypothetical protein